MMMRNCRISSIVCWSGDDMERVNKIWRHPVWKQQMEHLAEYEKNRIFCRHGMDHLMDVARIAYIENLEKNCGISKEIIYGAALLHDIGRYLQYTEGIPHEKAGEDLAAEILKDSGFTGKEQIEILEAIARTETKISERTAGLPEYSIGQIRSPDSAGSVPRNRIATGVKKKRIC